MRTSLVALPLLALLGGCETARIALPATTLESTERLPIEGISGWQDGRLRIGQSEGGYRLRTYQGRSFDGYIRDIGTSSFSLRGPLLAGPASGNCGHEQGEYDIGIGTLPAGRLGYRCRLGLAGRDDQGALWLVEVPRGSGLLAGRTRAGEVRLGSARLDIQPIHAMAGGRMETGSPLGYSFHRDGRQVGAVDLSVRMIHAPRDPGADRDAVVMAGIALALFRDPGD